MSIKRINELPEGSGSLTTDDIFLFMDDPSGGGVTKKISLNQISAAIGGGGAAVSHTHTVSQISATGTASSTTFLRGDGAWAAAEVSDGNRGDITVSASGATWTINAGVVVTGDLADGAVTDAKVTSITAAKITGVATLPTTGLTITKTGDWAPQSPVQAFTIVPSQATQIGSTYTRYSGKWITSWNYSESAWGTTGGSRVSSLSFDDLEGCNGAFTPNNMGALTTLSLPALSYVGSNFTPSAMAALTTLSLPALSYVGGNCNPATMGVLTTLSLPVLSYVGSAFSPATMNALTTLSLPVLSYVGGNFIPGAMGALTTLSLPALSYVGSNFIPTTMAALTTLSLPVLSYVNGNFNPTTMGALTTLSLPALSYVNGNFNPTAMGALTTLSLPALSYVGGNFNPTTMGVLANVTLPTNGTLKTILGSVTMTGMALTVTSVDNILQALASLDGTNGTGVFGTGRSVDLSGGTSAAPSIIRSTTTAGSNFVCSGTTCTVNWTGHGYSTGDVLRISGVTTATNANRYAVITVVNANQFTYTITSQTATGAGTATVVLAGASAKALVTRGVTLTTN